MSYLQTLCCNVGYANDFGNIKDFDVSNKVAGNDTEIHTSIRSPIKDGRLSSTKCFTIT